jgi:adenine-specific DNA-methyltransferase
MLRSLWNGQSKVVTIENDYKRYVGAQIGIYNLDGEIVGTVSHLFNKEFIFIASKEDVSDTFASVLKH